MKKIIFLIVVITTCSFLAKGKPLKDTVTTNNITIKGKNFFGINLGTTSGFGFSYMYFPNSSGFQVALIPLFDKRTTRMSVGATYFYSIKSFENSNFILFCSNHITNFFVEDNKYAYHLD